MCNSIYCTGQFLQPPMIISPPGGQSNSGGILQLLNPGSFSHTACHGGSSIRPSELLPYTLSHVRFNTLHRSFPVYDRDMNDNKEGGGSRWFNDC